MATNTTITISAVDKTQAAFNSVDRSLKKVEATSAKVARSVGGLTTALKATVAAFAVDRLIEFSDAAANIENRLKLVTSTTQELTQAQSALFKISQETGQSFQSTADLYSRLARVTGRLGVSTAELEEVTRSLGKAIAISGSTSESANAAIIQLGQGFAAGVLRGEELNSVMEQTPRVAQAIADGLGITIGELREYGKQGKLSAQTVFEALQSQAGVLEEEFARTSRTIGQSFTILENSGIRLAGIINQVAGANESLGGAIRDVAAALDSITESDVAFYMDVLTGTIGAIVDVFTNVIDKIQQFISQDDEVLGYASIFAKIRLGVELLSASIQFLTDLIADSFIGMAFRALEITFKTISADINQLIGNVMLLDDAFDVFAATAQLMAAKANPFGDVEEALQKVIVAQEKLSEETKKVGQEYITAKDEIAKIKIITDETTGAASRALEVYQQNVQTARDTYTTSLANYELGLQQEFVEKKKAEFLSEQAESTKVIKKSQEELLQLKQKQEAAEAASVLAALTFQGITEKVGGLLGTQGSLQEQLTAAKKAQALLQERLFVLASSTGDESYRQFTLLTSINRATKQQVAYLEDQVSAQQAGFLAQAEKAKQALIEQATYEKTVEEVAKITKNLQDQEAIDLATKALKEQAIYEETVQKVAKITEQLRNQEAVDLATKALVRARNEEKSLKLLERQSKQAKDIAKALNAQEQLKALKAQDDQLKAQAESIRQINNVQAIALATAVELEQLTLEQATALAAELGIQKQLTKEMDDRLSLAEKYTKEVLKGVRAGAQAITESDTAQAVMAAAGPSGQRAANVAKITADKGLEQGLLALVLSNEKVQEALAKVFDALFALVDPIIDLLVPVVEALIPVIEAMQPIFEKLQRPIEKLAPLLVKQIELLAPLIDAILFLVEGIESVFGAFENAMQGIFQPILDSFNGLGSMFQDQLVDPLKNVFSRMLTGLQEFGGAIQGTFEQVLLDFRDAFGNLVGGIEHVFEQIFSGGIFNFVDFIRQKVIDIFKAFVPGGTIPLLPNPFHMFGLGPKNLLEFKFAKGGYLNGPSHAAGGMPAMVGGRMPVELEGGEFIIRKSAVDQLGTNLLSLLNSVTDSGRKKQMNQLLGPAMSFGAGGLAQGLLASNKSFGKAGLSLRDLGSVGNLIADVVGNFGAELKLGIPNLAEGRIGFLAAGGLVSEGKTASPVNYGFEAGNDLLGRIKVGLMGRFFPPAIGLNASYSKPSWWPFAQGGSIPTLRGAAMSQNYQAAPKIDVNIYDGTGQLISQYDSAIRVEIKERAARFGEFPAVA